MSLDLACETDATGISASEPDWNRERCTRSWDPGRRMLKAFRAYQRAAARGTRWGRLKARMHVPFYRFWAAVCGADIPLNTWLGGGLAMPHGNGIVIHPDATIGPNCLIFQQVTIGSGGTTPGVPTIGGHVDIGAGAKILGGVRIGNHAKIGANAVVLSDVPAHATAVGIPARVISTRPQTSAELTRASNRRTPIGA